MNITKLGTAILLVTLVSTTGCVVEHERGERGYRQGYKEGYYDREHHRYWHERAWRDCIDHDEHCHD